MTRQELVNDIINMNDSEFSEFSKILKYVKTMSPSTLEVEKKQLGGSMELKTYNGKPVKVVDESKIIGMTLVDLLLNIFQDQNQNYYTFIPKGHRYDPNSLIKNAVHNTLKNNIDSMKTQSLSAFNLILNNVPNPGLSDTLSSENTGIDNGSPSDDIIKNKQGGILDNVSYKEVDNIDEWFKN